MPLHSPYERLPGHADRVRSDVSLFTKILLFVCALPCLLVGAFLLFLAMHGDAGLLLVAGGVLMVIGTMIMYARSTAAIIASLVLGGISVGFACLAMTVIGAAIFSR